MTRDIPGHFRLLVLMRDRHRCVRCRGRGSDWHHRRSRLVRDAHQHCACVGIMLCRTCHRWVHEHPLEARRLGFIVSKFVREPWTVPVLLPDGVTWRFQNCKGKVVLKLTDEYGDDDDVADE